MGKTKTGGLWYGVLVFGLAGQIAWMIENMYLNVFLYKTITFNLNATSAMVALSALTATVATLFAGVWSDRLGMRRRIISTGYCIWGVSVMAFSLVSVHNIEGIFPGAQAVRAATVLLILLDCVMTLFGSSANDAAFNAWVTDNTTDRNRGRVEGVLQVMPLAALLVVFGALDGLTKQGNWTQFFCIVGAVTVLAGLTGFLFVHDSPALRPNPETSFSSIFYGFKPSTVARHRTLYLIFCALCLVCVGNNVFLPYLMIYIEYFLGIANYVPLLGCIIIGASVVSVLFGFAADKADKRLLFIPAFALYLGGGVWMSAARGALSVGFAGFFLMAGNLSVLVLLASLVRIHTPPAETGLFQGIRMVFAVLVPMCVGPFIGSFISSTSRAIYTDPVTLANQPVPSNYIFLGAACVTALALVPVLVLCLYRKGALLRKAV